MSEERTGKCLWQVKQIHGHLSHIYSIAVNQVMVATVKLSKWWLQILQRGIYGAVAYLLAETLYQGNPFNWEIYTPYAGTAGM